MVPVAQVTAQVTAAAEAEVPAHTLKAKEAMVGRLTDHQQAILAFLVAVAAAAAINGVTVEKEAKAEMAP